jgi:hypothetical protein
MKKQGSMFCFCLLQWDLSNHKASCHVLVSWESSRWVVWVQWLGLRLFGATGWKILIIGSFSQWKSKIKKLKQKSVLEFGGILDVVGKPLPSKDLVKFISQFSELRLWKIFNFLSGFCCWKFKNWVWKENFSWALSQCVRSHCGI